MKLQAAIENKMNSDEEFEDNLSDFATDDGFDYLLEDVLINGAVDKVIKNPNKIFDYKENEGATYSYDEAYEKITGEDGARAYDKWRKKNKTKGKQNGK